MTRTIDDAFSVSDRPERQVPAATVRFDAATCLLEQAKGVLIFRYSIDAIAAAALIDLWGTESGAGVEAVAHALVRDICQGDCGSEHDAWLVRWLEDRLRHECPPIDVVESSTVEQPTAVAALVDHSDSSLDAVVDAAREAVRRGVPLEIGVDPEAANSGSAMARTHLGQRVELAVELARAVAPELHVSRPAESEDDRTRP